MILTNTTDRFKNARYWLPGVILLLLSVGLFVRLWEDDSLKLTYSQSLNGGIQVFYDQGSGYSEEHSFRYRGTAAQIRYSLSFPIEFDEIRSLRIDPSDNDGKVVFYKIGLKRRGNFFTQNLIRDDYRIRNGIRSLYLSPEGRLVVEPARFFVDPYFIITEFPPRPVASALWLKLSLTLIALWVVLLLSMRYAGGFWQCIACMTSDGVGRLFSFFKREVDETELESRKPFPWWFHAIMVLLILGMLVFSRSILLPFPGFFADDVHKWIHGKILLGEVPLSEWSWDHHTARLSTMAVVWLIQAIFGTDPVIYYLVPFVANIACFLGMYWVGCKIVHPIPSLVATVMLILLSPSPFFQLMPSPFVAAFVVLGSVYYFKTTEVEESSRLRYLYAAVAAVFVFLSYLSWIGALFFLPAFAWLFFRKTGYKTTALFLGILLGAYLLETILYAIFAGIPRGRLGIILGNYFEEVDYRNVWMDFFRRYNYLPGLTKTFVLYFIYSIPVIFVFRKWLPSKYLSFVLFPISFLLLLTFGVKSLHPLSLFLGYNQPRYAYSGLPFIYLSLAGLAWVPFSLLRRVFRSRILRSPVFHLIIALLFVGYFVNQFWLSRNPRYFFTTQKQHLDAIVRMSELAMSNDLMVVEMDHRNAKGIKFYNDMIYPRSKNTPSLKTHWINFGGRHGMAVFPGNDVEELTEELFEYYKHQNICLIFEEMPVSARFETINGLLERGERRKAKLWIGCYGETVEWVVKLLSKPGKIHPIQQMSLEAEGNAWSMNGGDFPKKTEDPDSWGSWSGDDHRTGKLTLKLQVNHARKALRIPVRTGPNPSGISITIEDMKTGEKIVALEEFESQVEAWGYLDIPIVAFEGTDEIKVVFEDAGAEWGAWMAIVIPGWL